MPSAAPTSDQSNDRASRLIADLDGPQRTAVTSTASPLCILAGAGSGKTRVLTRRIAYRAAVGTLEPRHVLAVTFTRKAASELTSRLAKLGLRERPAAGTFHSLAFALLRQRWIEGGGTIPTVLDRKSRILVPLVNAQRSLRVQAIDIATEIEWAKARMVPPSEYVDAVKAAGRRTPALPSAVAALYAGYESAKAKKKLVDFDDLLGLCADAIEHDPEFAQVVHWRFRHVFVDEFQDVNPLQHRLLEAWRGHRPDLCVVGDPNQAIYAWNGADASFLTDFASHFPGGETVHLVDNYRSSPQILAAANAVLASATSPGSDRLTPHSEPGPLPTIRSFSDDRSEATGIAQAVRRQHDRGVPWRHVAVLTRTNAQLALITEAFAALKIPAVVRGGGNLLQQPEVAEALAALQRSPAGMGFESALADRLDPAELQPLTDDRRANIETLVRLGHDYAAVDPHASAAGFAAWLTSTMRAGDSASSDGVDLATFHAAKGLEWPVVFLAGLEQGYVPIGQASTPEQISEELRLLYVAVTRAERELHCSWSGQRTFGERVASRQPSQWLASIEVAISAMRAGAEPLDWRAALAQARAVVDSANENAGRSKPGSKGRTRGRIDDDEADPLLAALKSWRRTTSQAAAVPAYVIFSDATLIEIAKRRPRNEQSLLKVSGVGQVKASRWGDAVLQIVRDQPAIVATTGA